MKALAIALTLGTAVAVTANAQNKIEIKGSDTLGAKMVPQLAEAYKAVGNDVDFDIAAEGSSQAFTALEAGTAQIGMSSRSAKDEEINKFTAAGKELVEHVVGVDMIAVIVNESNGVENLTKKQIEGIFTGDITDWAEVGGKPGKIAVFTRNTASGTYKTFQKLGMDGRDYGSETQKMAGNEQIAAEVAQNASGIGYVGLAYADKEGVKSAKVDGVEASPKFADTYPLSRNLYFYTIGDPTGEVKKFVEWVKNDNLAHKVTEKVGFIAVK